MDGINDSPGSSPRRRRDPHTQVLNPTLLGLVLEYCFRRLQGSDALAFGPPGKGCRIDGLERMV